MTKNNQNHKKRILFTGSIETFCNVKESLEGYNFSYFSNPKDVLEFNKRINFAIFEKSNRDIISGLRHNYRTLPIFLMEGRFRKSVTEKYTKMGIYFPITLEELKKEVDYYL